MRVSAVGRKQGVGQAGRPAAQVASAPALSFPGDNLRLTRRDGAAEAAAPAETPGVKKMVWGGGIAAASIVGLGLTLSTVGMPVLVPIAFGAGVLVGGGLLLKGAREFADHLAGRLERALPR